MTSHSSERRYALYFAPAATHPLSRAAALWMGRNPFISDTPARTDRSRTDVLLTAEPRRYGFHATLKAPFRLAPGTSREQLQAALRQFVQRRPPCPIGPMQVTTLGGFFALAPRKPAPFLQAFAGQVVSEFDRFRAPDDVPGSATTAQLDPRRAGNDQFGSLGLSICVRSLPVSHDLDR